METQPGLPFALRGWPFGSVGCVPPAPQTPTPLPAPQNVPGAQELAPLPGMAGVAWGGDPRGSKASELSRCVFCLLGQLAVGVLSASSDPSTGHVAGPPLARLASLSLLPAS